MDNNNPQAKVTTSDKSASKTTKHEQKVLESPSNNTILDSYAVGSFERGQQVNGSRYPFQLNKDGSMTIGRALLQMMSMTPVVLKDASSIAVDATMGSHFYVTLGGNRTLANPIGAADGQHFIFEIIQDGSGSRTLTLDTKFAFGTTLASITLSTTAGLRDFIGVIYRKSTDKFYVVAFTDGY